MSFYSGNRTHNCPGPINGNPLNGICEKACIKVDKVFDACLKQLQENDVQVTATSFTPANPVQPLTYVSAHCVSGAATINNLVVDRFEDKPCFARVSGDIVIPIEINYTDANGVPGVATANLTVTNDVVLYVPQPSIVPFRVEAFASCVSPDGDYIGNDVFSLDFCLSIIMRVVVEAEILVPTYGYCPIPPCQEFTQDVCSGFFDLPLYPAQQPVCGSNCGGNNNNN